MKHVHLLKFIMYAFASLGAFLKIIEPIYVSLFSRPLFVHFYFVKKKLPRKERFFLIENVAFYKKLDVKYQSYFEHRVAMFLRTYDFIGRDKFTITPEVKVLIASSYIKLTFGMRNYLTTVFDKVLVYPSIFYSTITEEYHKGEFNPMFKMTVFSWEDFLLGDIVTNDNLNLGIHEFSHALTFHGRKSNDVSASIFYDMFTGITNSLNDENEVVKIKKVNYFREYALTNKLEFIAVVLEHFFETPKELKQHFPELFKQLSYMLNYHKIIQHLHN